MKPPPKVYLDNEEEYKNYFEKEYCTAPIITFDGIPVYFSKKDFYHCMYESTKRDDVKDMFSRRRAERISWIEETLKDPQANLYQGWDRKKKRCNPSRRVAILYEDFVVVIQLGKIRDGKIKAKFVTAYLADESIDKIRLMPKWVKNKCR